MHRRDVAVRSPGTSPATSVRDRGAGHSQDSPERLVGRLTSLGFAQDAAEDLLAGHSPARVANAVATLEALSDGSGSAGWLMTAVREGWNLRGFLADRGQDEARLRRLDREQADRDATEAARQQRQETSARWGAAISAALDDEALAAALEHVTTAVPGIGRRSVPLARAQLLGWAVAVHQSDPGVPLGQALARDLRDGGATPPAGLRDLDEAPSGPREVDDLSQRIAEALDRRPDLACATAGLRTSRRAVELEQSLD